MLMRRRNSSGSGSSPALISRRAAHTLKSGSPDISIAPNPDLRWVSRRTDRFNHDGTSERRCSFAELFRRTLLPVYLPRSLLDLISKGVNRQHGDEREQCANDKEHDARHDRHMVARDVSIENNLLNNQ